MATVQDLKRRIRSVRNTRKITKAMELVASARLRRAQQRIEAMRPYADRMLELMAGTARAAGSVRQIPLLQPRDVRRVAIVPLTADRGLAGPFNGQILRRAFALERELRGDAVRTTIATCAFATCAFAMWSFPSTAARCRLAESPQRRRSRCRRFVTTRS